MKSLKILIFLSLLIFSCAKNSLAEIDIQSKKTLDYETLKSIFDRSYDFSIYAKKNSLTFKENGFRDISGNISVKGYMDISGEARLVYDHIFDKESWYAKEGLKKEYYNQPIDPLMIIENSIIGEPVLREFNRGKYIFDAEINVAVIDPLNYSAKGIIETDEKLSYVIISAENENLKYIIELRQKKHNPIKVPREVKLRCSVFGGKPEIKQMEERLSGSNIGFLKDGKASFYVKEYNVLKRLLEEDSLSFYSYEYTDPSSEGDDIAYIQGDVRNSVRITEKIASVCMKEAEIVSKGKEFEVEFLNVDMNNDSKIVLRSGDIAFTAIYERETKKLRLNGLSEIEALLIISVNDFPYKKKSVILNKEE